MELSLQFIAQKLAFSYDVDVLDDDPTLTYGTVRVFDVALSTSSKFHPIVIISSKARIDTVADQFRGIIWIGEERPAFGLPAIWIRDDVSELLLLDRVQNIFDMFNQWCASVQDGLLQHRSFDEIVPLLSQVTISPYYYADASMRTLAIKEDETLYAASSSWRMQSEVGRHPVEILARFVSSGELDTVNSRKEAWLFDSDTFHTPFVSKTIFCQGDVFGHLFLIETYPGQATCDVEILEAFGNMLETHLDLSSMTYSSSGRPYEPMLISQIEGLASSAAETDYLLKLLSWGADEQYRIALLKHPAGDGDSAVGNVASEIQAIEDNLVTAKAFYHNGAIVCVINNSRAESLFADNLILHFCERFGWKVAISNASSSFSSLQSLYNRALATFDIGCQLSPKTILYHFDDYRLLLIFSAITKSGYADFLLHDDLIALAQYDEENDSEMVSTLKTYLDLERNSSKTAEALHLHRNSVTYRLEKIKSLMSSDLDEPENRLLLTLSIYYFLSQRGK
ncbi:MAG: helix-turn-helix domain-containing protein [Eggerthellaceae bacterium]|nr:helix-turn-helix domain-containing protein [Eggerthellaceae bacterium]MBQ9044214.1 helix-turn-helix domain-containing protein [Eggerthellaceae bacterium]